MLNCHVLVKPTTNAINIANPHNAMKNCAKILQGMKGTIYAEKRIISVALLANLIKIAKTHAN